MTDSQDLHARAGQIEQAICELDDEHSDLLDSLQNGLNSAREKLIRKKFETDRLTEENNKLKRLMERLLEHVESKPKKALHDKLKDLDVQLNVLLEISEDETVPGQVGPGQVGPGQVGPGQVGPGHAGEDPAAASRSNDADGGSDEPADIVSPAANGSLSDESGSAESSSLQDIETRVHHLFREFTEIDEKSANLPREPELHRPEPEPEPVDPEQPGEPCSSSISENLVLRAPFEEKHGVRHATNRKERKAFDRLIRSSADTVRRVLPKARMRFDAEVEYALGILRQMLRGDRLFSVEQVRGLINGKFDLNLTAQHDGQIAASLSKRDNVTRTAKRSTTWKLGSVA